MSAGSGQFGTQRFVLDSYKFADPNVQQAFNQLIDLLNNAQIPIPVGPEDKNPIGMTKGQPVIFWDGTNPPTVSVYNGETLT